MEIKLREGVAEAVMLFWRMVDARTPPVLDKHNREFVNQALLVALGKLNKVRDQREGP